MKKFLSLVLALILVCGTLSMISCGEPAEGGEKNTEDTGNTDTPISEKVAMITDYGDITDQSFNQTTYEACKSFCEAKGMTFNYYKPTDDSTEARVAMVDAAVNDGYNVIVMPGYAFAGTIKEVAGLNPDVKFVALDVSAGDLGDDYTLPANVFCAVYQEELAGYMAGYAAVKEGYKHLGFLGGMSVPAVMRYGYGFVQGANDAAGEEAVTIEYAYGNQFNGDADITAYMDTWYQSQGVEVVFACGGGIFTSAAEAAAKVGGKIIGVDVDQSAIIDSYGEGMCITSAMKGLSATVKTVLEDIVAGKWADYSGKITTLGLVSGTDPEANYVQLPTATWTLKNFSVDDYKALVADLFDGKITVSNDTSKEPTTAITVNYLGNIK